MHFNGRCNVTTLMLSCYFHSRLRALNAHLPTPASDMSSPVWVPFIMPVCHCNCSNIGLANVIQISFRLWLTVVTEFRLDA